MQQEHNKEYWLARAHTLTQAAAQDDELAKGLASFGWRSDAAAVARRAQRRRERAERMLRRAEAEEVS